jgi:hypothetical protein
VFLTVQVQTMYDPIDSRRPRALTLGLFLIAALSVSACEAGTGPPEVGDDRVAGTWFAQGSGMSEYIQITDAALRVYSERPAGYCYQLFDYEISGRDGSGYRLTATDGSESLTVFLERDGENLVVRHADLPEGQGVRYAPTTEDLSRFEVCAGGGYADVSQPCGDLEQLAVGGSITGGLLESDPISWYGGHWDLYGLQIDATRTVTIEMASEAFDAYLWLYDEDGAVIQENDDADAATLDAAVTAELAPGCYRVEASSFDGGDTGYYSLGVREDAVDQ